jgi:xanthine/CO dehydrogenase XdhC/CoxF family maturation factor
MSFDRESLRAAVAACGAVARVVVAAADGSTPREAGAAMLVWDSGQSGTIGGGALEHAAAARAREALSGGRDRIDRAPLGPALGQCCGGAVTLLTEVWTAERLALVDGDVVARPVPGGVEAMPLSVARLLAASRSRGELPAPALTDGWMVEPVSRPARALWVWGAGHVGRAIVAVLAPLPEVAISGSTPPRTAFPKRSPRASPALSPPTLPTSPLTRRQRPSTSSSPIPTRSTSSSATGCSDTASARAGSSDRARNGHGSGRALPCSGMRRPPSRASTAPSGIRASGNTRRPLP